jgi:transcriptional regulator GlxA family with amidase domain
MIRATFVLSQHVLLTSVTLPTEMLRAADAAWASAHAGVGQLEINTAAIDKSIINTQTGFEIMPEQSLADTGQCDLVFFPGLWRNPRPILKRSAAVYPWLRDQFEGGALISAAGTGVCFLAEAGLLDNKPATTHWYYADQFAKDYPAIDLKHEYFITQAGSLFCAASINAFADITVHLIERIYGRQIASHVERNFSHEIRRPYAKHRYLEGQNIQHPDELIVETQFWLQENLGVEIDFRQVAQHFGISTRSLNRRFKSATGSTPVQYLQRLRAEIAKELLQSTNLSLGEVAYRVGYQDNGHFTRVFKKFMGTTPGEYRATVRAKLFTAV